jgi:hypothetical protein
LPVDESEPEIVARESVPTPPLPDSLEQLPKLEPPSVERRAIETAETALRLAEPATRSPAIHTPAIEVTPSAPASADVR